MVLGLDDVVDKALLLVVLTCAAFILRDHVRTLVRLMTNRNKEGGLRGQTNVATNSKSLAESVADLYKWCRVIDQNLAYILRELPGLKLPADARGEISAVCVDFQGTMHDMIAEMRILEDKLGLHPGEAPADPNVASRDPRVNLELIGKWLSGDADKLNALVRNLWALQQQDPNTYTLVNALVTESATNILHAVAGAKEEMRNISKRLSARGRE